MPSLPDELAELTEGYALSRFPYYETAAKIYRLSSEDSGLYLKIIEGQQTLSLERESRILRWINGRTPTPRLLYYGVQDGNEYQLTTEVTGTPTYQVEPAEREHAVKALGEALKLIHSMNPSGCPIDNRIGNRLKQLQENDVDTSQFKDQPDESLVFTHGDYSLPNIIIEDRELSGVIDWDYAGLADPYPTQTAAFAPRGLAGTLYWYSLYPFHRLIFTDMINAIAADSLRDLPDQQS